MLAEVRFDHLNIDYSGMMPGVDYAVLGEWFEWMTKNCAIGVDLFVYLRATPETCLDRIRQRNRKEESLVPLVC